MKTEARKMNEPTPALIRSVFIAGMDNGDSENLFTRTCTNYFLKVVHWGHNEATRDIPNCDAAIIASDNCGHDLIGRTRKAYEGKTLFSAVRGFSFIKEAFEEAVFGRGVLQVLFRPTPMHRVKHTELSLPMKLAWILARFYGKGTTVKVSEFNERLQAFFGDKGIGCNSLLSQYKDTGCITSDKWGYFTFHGITHNHYLGMLENGLPADYEWQFRPGISSIERRINPWDKPKVVITPKKPELPDEDILIEDLQAHKKAAAPEPTQNDLSLKSLHDETQVSMELLLESMGKQQQQFEHLSENVTGLVKTTLQAELGGMEKLVQKTIQSEIQGITKFLGDIVPQLHGLPTEQLQRVARVLPRIRNLSDEQFGKVEQLLDLFLGM